MHWGEMSGGLEEEEGKYRTLVAPHLPSYHLSLISELPRAQASTSTIRVIDFDI